MCFSFQFFILLTCNAHLSSFYFYFPPFCFLLSIFMSESVSVGLLKGCFDFLAQEKKTDNLHLSAGISSLSYCQDSVVVCC